MAVKEGEIGFLKGLSALGSHKGSLKSSYIMEITSFQRSHPYFLHSSVLAQTDVTLRSYSLAKERKHAEMRSNRLCLKHCAMMTVIKSSPTAVSNRLFAAAPALFVCCVGNFRCVGKNALQGDAHSLFTAEMVSCTARARV